MKNLRKKLSFIIIFTMIISAIPFSKVSADSGTYTDGDGNEWYYVNDYNDDLGLDGSTYKVRQATLTSVKGVVTIPSKIGDKAVTTIYAGSTGNSNKLVTQLTIPNSIINIESGTFNGWSNLEKVNFESDSKLRVIQSYAFNGCNKLSTFNIPASVEEIGILYPGKLTGFNIFDSCSNLESITVEEGNNHFKTVDGVLYSMDDSTIYLYPSKKPGTTYVIPASVQTINESAFGNSNLNSISIAEGSQLTTLKTLVFKSCMNLSEITGIPSTLVEIGWHVFSDTPWLKNQITTSNPYLVINSVLVTAYNGLTVPSIITIPEGVTRISKDVFTSAGLKDNMQLTIPASVIKIDNNAFTYLNFSSIQFANGSQLEEIGEFAFSSCNKISTLDLPANLTTIGDRAFSNMNGLKTLAIPDSVTYLGESIVSSGINLEHIYTNNVYVKSVLNHDWTEYKYTFEPYENYNRESLTGAVDITGDVKVGQTLTAITTGITNTDPGNYKYSWYRVNALTNIQSTEPLGNNNTYTIAQNDVGHKIKLVVSAANCNGDLSAITDVIPKGVCPVTNVPTSGVVHNDGTSKSFTFTGLIGVTYEYSKDNGETWNKVVPIIGEQGESATFTISLGNIAFAKGGLKVRAAETSEYNASTPITNDSPFTASLEGNVVITGTLKYNETLTANVSNQQNNAELNYKWYRNGTSTPIKTSSNNEYTIVGEDIGKTITVKVSAAGYTDALEYSTNTTISKADAFIAIPNDSRTYLKTYGYADFYLKDIANNVGGTYTYKNSHPDVLSIAPDGKIHIIKAMDGTCTIEIGLAESDYYTAAQSINVFINVGKADTVSIALSKLNQVSNAITKPTVTMTPYSKTAFDKIKIEYGVTTNDVTEWSEVLPDKEGNYKVRATLLSTEANTDSNIKIFKDITTEEQDFVITKYNPSNGGENPSNGGENPSNGGENPSNGGENPSNGGSNPSTGGGNPSTGNENTETDNNSTIINNDGSTTKTNTTKNSDGSSTTTKSTVNKDGSKTETETTSSTVTNKNGTSKTIESTKEIITGVDGTSLVITTKAETSKNTDGSSTKKSVIALDSETASAVKINKTDKDGKVTSSSATITVNDSKISISKANATVGVDISTNLLKAVADSDHVTDVIIVLDKELAKTAIMNQKVTTVTLAVDVPTVKDINIKGTSLSKDIANLASKNKKDLEIAVDNKSGTDYSVKIAASDLGKVKKDLNLSLEVFKYDEIANTKLVSTIKSIFKSNSSAIQVVSFSDNKTLETGLTLSYDLSNMKDVKAGDKVNIYKFNSKTNKLEEVANNSVKVNPDGTITSTTIQGGDFIVSSEKLSDKNVTKLVDKITVNTDKALVKVGSKSNVKVTLPVDVLKVDNFNGKSNPIGKEEAKITFKVNDESIAKVDSKGNITSKKAGNAVVTVTVKLENGQQKTYKKSIQVK